ncbi:MarR family winged helix-turn-helix transcriptional regulator [Microbacterium ulmi]|uniref:Winged helix-turn-helix transcriptional regulator n=1 Tax=Microbacterium ulmi TaxID=179095 RepID=A0A7Y2PZR1_9MICO|nr:MarR family winged helix-turn-helix transcriptional regulator [Microbacterium ulmi]NII71212.1 DNA-binding MarR family transcriptional regulator [Microbacterium ulmi]NNH02517.1 winged helix-turn-helix transcriptional regulator [Microbacterium ulmi]
MSTHDDAHRSSIPGRLSSEQLRVWLTYMRVRLRLSYEMGRQLQADSGITLADYDVLAALYSRDDRTMAVSQLAQHVGWERSRASHQVDRMARRGLVERRRSEIDRRVTEVTLLEEGVTLLRAATPLHFALVQRVFFAGIATGEELDRFGSTLESIYRTLCDEGSIPPPPAEQPEDRRVGPS